MSELDVHVESDYVDYIKYTENRISLSTSGFENEIKELYDLLYLFSSNIDIYQDLDKKSFMWEYISETKNDLIISFDLLNINYLTASKRILRSAIESFFRFSLCFSRFKEYSQNKENNIYNVTDNLKELKSMTDTHKVGKMTFYTKNYFSNTIINKQVDGLYNKYSSLSSSVHVNSKTSFSPQRFLNEYSSVKNEDVSKNIKIYRDILIDMLLSLYYFDSWLSSSTFTKRSILKLELIGGEYAKAYFDQYD
ncbi:hypothetical protein [Enterococcus durans]|uniref:hypothetical protein n=1 Tax=Enterococcus durans TaxID=53345 RepID=UPI001CF327F7|nr:hypothetical protein [Enterococcus durans]MCA6741442.1 hypothetical protein [Enterococcus durans]